MSCGSRATAKDEAKRQARQEAIKAAHRAYLAQGAGYLERARTTRLHLEIGCGIPSLFLQELDGYRAHAERQIDQIRRRVLLGERIPHAIFQPHIECGRD